MSPRLFALLLLSLALIGRASRGGIAGRCTHFARRHQFPPPRPLRRRRDPAGRQPHRLRPRSRTPGTSACAPAGSSCSGPASPSCSARWTGSAWPTRATTPSGKPWRKPAPIPQRVTVHTLHQHDAPECDFGAEKILKDAGVEPLNYEGTFAREVLARLGKSIRQSLELAQPVTHVGLGEGAVFQVASNRRILGPDGKVRAVRWTATTDPAVRGTRGHD